MLFKISSILSALVAVWVVLVESQNVCPPYANDNTFVPCDVVNGTCYCVASQKQEDGLFMLWDDADAFCRSANLRLVSIESAEKDREVINTINNFWVPWNGYIQYWTSGRYNANITARWEWAATGQPLTYAPPYCCNGPTQPCNCPPLLFPSNGERIVNHGYNGFWYWYTANHTETFLPFTCEGRNYV